MRPMLHRALNRFQVFLDIDNRGYFHLIASSLALICVVAAVSIFIRGPMAWLDEPTHYFRAIQLANGDLYSAPDNDHSQVGGRVSITQQRFAERAWLHIGMSLTAHGDSSVISTTWKRLYRDLTYSDRTIFAAATNAVPYTPVNYLPYTAVAKLNQLLHLDVTTEYQLMKATGFVVSFLLFVLAIKLTPYGKWTFCVLGLTPTMTLSMVSITADACSFAFVLLFIAGANRLFFKLLAAQSLTRADVVTFTAVALGTVAAKMPAFLLLLLLLPLIWISQRTRSDRSGDSSYTTFFLALLLLCTLLVAAWGVLVRDLNTGGFFNIENVNTFGQIGHILKHPVQYAALLLDSIRHFKFVVLQLGYGDTPAAVTAGTAASLFFLIAFIASLFVCDTKPKITAETVRPAAAYAMFKAALLLVITVTIFTLLYLQFNPVGSDEIRGVQPRYFLPYSALLSLLPGVGFSIHNRLLFSVVGGVAAVPMLISLCSLAAQL